MEININYTAGNIAFDGSICMYGCNQPAKYQFSNGRYCCSDKFTLCSAYRLAASIRQKGNNNSFFGKKHSDKTREMMSNSRKGGNNSFFGRKHTGLTKIKLSESRMGRCSGESNHNYGKPRSVIVRKKISDTRILKGIGRGVNNPNWRHGNTKGRKSVMSTTRYKEWRRKVFEKNDYTCVDCGKRGGELNADHIKPYVYFPECRYEVDNGATRCVACHRKTFKEVFKWRKMLCLGISV